MFVNNIYSTPKRQCSFFAGYYFVIMRVKCDVRYCIELWPYLSLSHNGDKPFFVSNERKNSIIRVLEAK